MRDPVKCEGAIRQFLADVACLKVRTDISPDEPVLGVSNAERIVVNAERAMSFAKTAGQRVITFLESEGDEDTSFFFVVPRAPAVLLGTVLEKEGLTNATLVEFDSLLYDCPVLSGIANSAAASPSAVCRLPTPKAVVGRYIRPNVLTEKVRVGRSKYAEKADAKGRHRDFLVTAAFAVTFHKVQGATIQKAVLELNKRPKKLGALSFGSLYVAMTRVKQFDGLRIIERASNDSHDYLVRLKPPADLITFLIYMRRNLGLCLRFCTRKSLDGLGVCLERGKPKRKIFSDWLFSKRNKC